MRFFKNWLCGEEKKFGINEAKGAFADIQRALSTEKGKGVDKELVSFLLPLSLKSFSKVIDVPVTIKQEGKEEIEKDKGRISNTETERDAFVNTKQGEIERLELTIKKLRAAMENRKFVASGVITRNKAAIAHTTEVMEFFNNQ